MGDRSNINARSSEVALLTRRQAVAGTGGIAATALALLASSGNVVAQAGTATPAADTAAAYIVIRTYGLQADAELGTLIEDIQAEFVPIIRGSPGFIAYYYLLNREANTVATVSIFSDQASADASNEQAADWIEAHQVADLYTGPPDVVAGDLVIAETA